jgi:DNA-binding NtrC family response regulator
MTLDSIYRSFLRSRKTTSRIVPALTKYEIVAISPDTRFFSSLVHTTAPYGWTVRWARSITGAEEMLAERSDPIIIYDCCSVADDWRASIARLRAVSEDSCIVMTAGSVSEELWQEALARRVYDVVSRVGHGGQLVATVEFAWKWRADRRSHYWRVLGRRKESSPYYNEARVPLTVVQRGR